MYTYNDTYPDINFAYDSVEFSMPTTGLSKFYKMLIIFIILALFITLGIALYYRIKLKKRPPTK
jgi:hypothetical protein